MRKYETIIVIDTLLKTEEIEGIINKYERFISANGGIIESIDRWGKRRLSYEIKKRQYGFYVLIRFEAPSAMIKQLDRAYRLNEFLLRTTVTKLDKKALAAMASQPQLFAQPQKPPESKVEEPADVQPPDEPSQQESVSEETFTDQQETV